MVLVAPGVLAAPGAGCPCAPVAAPAQYRGRPLSRSAWVISKYSVDPSALVNVDISELTSSLEGGGGGGVLGTVLVVPGPPPILGRIPLITAGGRFPARAAHEFCLEFVFVPAGIGVADGIAADIAVPVQPIQHRIGAGELASVGS